MRIVKKAAWICEIKLNKGWTRRNIGPGSFWCCWSGLSGGENAENKFKFALFAKDIIQVLQAASVDSVEGGGERPEGEGEAHDGRRMP